MKQILSEQIRHQVSLFYKTKDTLFSMEDISDALNLFSKSQSLFNARYNLVEKLVLFIVRQLQRKTSK